MTLEMDEDGISAYYDGFILNDNVFILKTTEFVLIMNGFVPNGTEFVLNMNGFMMKYD